jgi:hypothetical protein
MQVYRFKGEFWMLLINKPKFGISLMSFSFYSKGYRFVAAEQLRFIVTIHPAHH